MSNLLPRQPGESKSAEGQRKKGGPVEKISTGSILEERWEVGAQIAQTASGMLFQGRDILVDKHVVIKVVSPEFNSGESLEKLRERFRTASKLMQPNIIVYSDMIELPGGQNILIAPYVAAGSLDQELSQRGSLSIDRTIALCTQISGAFTYAHSKSVPHRLQASDVMLLKGDHERDVVKIVGFGASAEDVKRLPPFIKQTDVQNMYQSGTFAQTQRRPLTMEEISDDIQSFARVMRDMHNSGAQKSDDPRTDKGAEAKFKIMVGEMLGKNGKDLYPSFVDLQHDLALVIGGSDEDWNSKAAAQQRVTTRRRKSAITVCAVVVAAAAVLFAVNSVISSTAGSNSLDAGEQRDSLWPPGKATANFFSPPAPPAVPATTTAAPAAGGAKSIAAATTAPTISATSTPTDKQSAPAGGGTKAQPAAAAVGPTYDEAITTADTDFANGIFAKGIDTLTTYATNNDKTLTGARRVNVYGRLAAAQLQVNQADKATAAADEAAKALKNPDNSTALAALAAAATLAEIGLTKELTEPETAFIENVKTNLPHEARANHSARFALFAARLGDLMRAKKKFADAEQQYLLASQGWQLLPDHHIDLVKALYGLGLAYQGENKLSDSDESYDHAIKEASMEQGRKRLVDLIRSDYADMLWKKGDHSKALSVRNSM